MKILITGGNSSKALKLLKAFPNHFVVLADYGDLPAVANDRYAFESLGIINKESTAHILLNFCISQSIDSLIPLRDFEVESIAKSSVLFGEYGIHVLLPDQADLSNYISEDRPNYKNFAVFVHGECIFSSSGDIFVVHENQLNGVFCYNEPDDELKLFVI